MDQQEDAFALHNRGVDLWREYLDRRDVKTLDNALALFRAAVSEDDRNAWFLSNLSNALLEWYKHTDDRTALEEAVSVGRLAIASSDRDKGAEAFAANNLSGALKATYWLTKNLAFLQEATTVLRRSVEIAPDDASRAVLLSNLAYALSSQHAATDDPDALRESIAALRSSLTLRGRAIPLEEMVRLAKLLQSLHERTGDAGALNEAEDIVQQAVAFVPPGLMKCGLLSSLGVLIRLRYEQTGDRDVLNEAATVGRAAVAAAPDDALRASAYSNLGNTLSAGYERTQDEILLSQALEAHRTAVAAAADGHEQQAQILTNADRTVELSYQITGQLDLIDERIRLHRQRLGAFAHGTAERAGELADTADILRLRFEASSETDDLDAVIQALREAVAEAPPDYASRPTVLGNLGILLQIRSAVEGAMEEAIAALTEAIAGTPADDPARSPRLASLSQALRRKYELTGDSERLEDAIETGRAAVADGGTDRLMRATLADSLQARWEQAGDEDDLRQSMALFHAAPSGRDGAAADGAPAPPSEDWSQGPNRRAMTWLSMYSDRRDLAALGRAVELCNRWLRHPWLTSARPQTRAVALAQAAVAYLYRYNEFSDRADLGRALEYGAASVEFAGHEYHRDHLGNFAMVLQTKYEHDGDVNSLARAAELAEAVLDMTPEPLEERANALTNLGVVWRRMRLATGDARYLDAEVEAFLKAADLSAAGAAHYGRRLNNAAVGLHERYDERGDEGDLHRSIEYSRQALRVTRTDDFERAGWLSNLGNTLRHRHERTGSLADLDDAIDVQERAAAVTPQRLTERRQFLTNLGGSLRLRGDVSRSEYHLRRALEVAAEAVRVTPSTSPEYALFAGNLASVLGTTVTATGDQGQRDLEIDLYEELLDREPETSPRYSRLQHRLASALLDRITVSKNQTDLPRAVELTRASLARAVPGTIEYAWRCGTLARLLALSADPNRSLITEVVTAFRQACDIALINMPAYALSTALSWARWCEDGKTWAMAAEAYLLAAQAADALFATQIDRQDKEIWLRAANGMPAQAALALVRSGRPESAALMLERGRVRLLGEALGRNSAALDSLEREGHRALTESFRAVQRRLGALEATAVTADHEDGHADRMRGDDLSSALSDHAAALDAIRRVPGYEHFLLPAAPADLAAAADRPIVYLAAGRLAGVALVVTRERGDGAVPSVAALELPRLTEAGVYRRTTALQRARHGRERDPAFWNGTLDEVCRWLWLAAMEPVLGALASQPAACLIPAGLLASLPLHAAWTPDGTRITGRRYALDEVALSYAPSSLALRHAREQAERQSPVKLLGIADPQPVNAKPLALASAEVAAAAALLSGSFRELRGPAAERERILAELPHHSVVHFACHGQARPDVPLESALLTSGNQRLSLRDLFRLELAEQDRPGIRLAVLSACETQLPGVELPDELVSLPSGFLQAGAAAVVASQWSIGDAATALLITMFYRNLVSGIDGATALRDAQVWLRDTTAGEMALFMHPDAGQSGLPRRAARPLWRWLAVAAPHERLFSMPSQWAAMTYTGA